MATELDEPRESDKGAREDVGAKSGAAYAPNLNADALGGRRGSVLLCERGGLEGDVIIAAAKVSQENAVVDVHGACVLLLLERSRSR